MAKTQRFLSAPVGYGLDNKTQDIAATKRKLHELGFYKPRDTGVGDDFDAGFDAAIQNFQSRAGLRVDGVMKPGGETERNIEAYRTGEGFEAQPLPSATRLKGSVGAGGKNAPEDVIAAKRALAASGRYGYDRTRPPSPYTDEKLVEAMRGLERDHDLFESGTIDPDSPAFQAMIREADDAIQGVFPPSVAERKDGETQTAALPFLIPIALAGARLAAPHIARMVGSTAARIAGPNGAKSILGAAAAGALGQAANDAGKRPGAKHRMQTETENLQTPPSSAEPPIKLPTKEEYPAGERRPSVTVTPIPEQRKPEVEGYPAEGPRLSDKVIYQALNDDEFLRRLHILFNMRGNDQTQDLDDDVGNDIKGIGDEYGRGLEIIGGGFRDRNTRELRKQYWLKPQDHLKVPGNKRKNGSFILLRERFPEILFFIADEVGGNLCNWQPIDDPSRFHDREVWAFLPEFETAHGGVFNPNTAPKRFQRKRFYFRGNTGISSWKFANGRETEFMSFGWLRANHLRTDKETARFLAAVWRISAKISTSHVKQMNPATGETLEEDRDMYINRYGFDALRWCAERENRMLDFDCRPTDDWVMPQLPCYDQA